MWNAMGSEMKHLKLVRFMFGIKSNHFSWWISTLKGGLVIGLSAEREMEHAFDHFSLFLL